MMTNQSSDRPYSLPPTNVELDNDYVGIDRGLFLSRESTPRYLRVVEAQWNSHGPNTAPGILQAKIGAYNTKPETDEDYDHYELLTHVNGNEWFEVYTTGPIFKPILVEHWIKYIYYNYYVNKNSPSSLLDNVSFMNDIKSVGTDFVRALVPSIKSITNTANYSVSTGKPLELTNFTSEVTSQFDVTLVRDITEQAKLATKGFDPTIEVAKSM